MNYQMIKKNYQRGLWSKPMVAMAVSKGVLSAGQYQKITDEIYA